jgi:hypothetical protein
LFIIYDLDIFYYYYTKSNFSIEDKIGYSDCNSKIVYLCDYTENISFREARSHCVRGFISLEFPTHLVYIFYDLMNLDRVRSVEISTKYPMNCEILSVSDSKHLGLPKCVINYLSYQVFTFDIFINRSNINKYYVDVNLEKL